MTHNTGAGGADNVNQSPLSYNSDGYRDSAVGEQAGVEFWASPIGATLKVGLWVGAAGMAFLGVKDELTSRQLQAESIAVESATSTPTTTTLPGEALCGAELQQNLRMFRGVTEPALDERSFAQVIVDLQSTQDNQEVADILADVSDDFDVNLHVLLPGEEIHGDTVGGEIDSVELKDAAQEAIIAANVYPRGLLRAMGVDDIIIGGELRRPLSAEAAVTELQENPDNPRLYHAPAGYYRLADGDIVLDSGLGKGSRTAFSHEIGHAFLRCFEDIDYAAYEALNAPGFTGYDRLPEGFDHSQPLPPGFNAHDAQNHINEDLAGVYSTLFDANFDFNNPEIQTDPYLAAKQEFIVDLIDTQYYPGFRQMRLDALARDPEDMELISDAIAVASITSSDMALMQQAQLSSQDIETQLGIEAGYVAEPIRIANGAGESVVIVRHTNSDTNDVRWFLPIGQQDSLRIPYSRLILEDVRAQLDIDQEETSDTVLVNLVIASLSESDNSGIVALNAHELRDVIEEFSSQVIID